MWRIYILLLLTFTLSINAQISFNILTDKAKYDYGESIIITCDVKNNFDETKTLWSECTSSYQAEFEFNDYFSLEWTGCLTAVEQIVLAANQTRKYKWTINPKVYGLPNANKVQTLIGHFFYEETMLGERIELLDTITINAPIYLGGQVNVGFIDTLSEGANQIKEILGAEVILSNTYGETVNETWQIQGISVDSLVNQYSNDSRLKWFELNREISYDDITTSIINEKGLNILDYSLTQNYPNPFNPTTKISYQIPENSFVNLIVYNVLGQKVAKLINKYQSVGKYSIQFDADNLPSGVYIYKLQASEFTSVKKMILTK